MWRPSSEGRTVRKSREPLQLAITPLIDIVFLLLIFFMLTSRFVAQEGIKVDLPVTEKAHVRDAAEETVLMLRADGTIFFQRRLYTLETLASALSQDKERLLTRPVEIRADRSASVQSMVSLLELLRGLGARRVSVATVHQSPGASP